MISKKDVEYIANLANLEVDEADKDVFAKQLGDILEYVEKLNELDTDGVVPTAYTVPMKNVFREDKAEPSIKRDKALANAPDKKDGQFRVPPIISE
ncbi:Asp-tRNA(Asn)/Glu-tRNA(Gln) amidotransferase subunit GatC [Halocella sp. SP3-1]|uniref:Asp-tRNA(Asn)/Glu-tRNA(Gln) amidotransferase subunit GatC n=1 Tax=Halocella sp. SP3-1 TaxID=2382161 RepID=UPI000F75BE33|nr:Asp-tRNA(Asn)/Glu-tRNA(Gln) amidotransferase subunit GatC [Halocella sp. SP3-1]AZO96248.1 Asp-tRNA(Asn)/Glu-tRNA(Gln) amidotransferase subunit GatC [Halocella sp. SP3-1]